MAQFKYEQMEVQKLLTCLVFIKFVIHSNL